MTEPPKGGLEFGVYSPERLLPARAALDLFRSILFLDDAYIRKHFPQFFNDNFPEPRVIWQLVHTHKISNRKKR
jgi:hypothetical protein